jgi:hypothetical protein
MGCTYFLYSTPVLHRSSGGLVSHDNLKMPKLWCLVQQFCVAVSFMGLVERVYR